MFNNLIESGSHRRDLARRSRFFLGTLATYAVLVAAAGVASVYAYTAHLDAQNYEVTMLPPLATTPTTAQTPPERPAAPRRGGSAGVIPERTILIASLNTPPRTPPPISTVYNPIPPMPPGYVRLGEHNTGSDRIVTGTIGPAGDDGIPIATNSRHRVVEVDDTAPTPPQPTPAPTPRKPVQLSSLISSKIVSKPVPPYPQIAVVSHTQGSVTVEILVDEQGRVVAATATSGPALLRAAAQQAAMLARFTPTQLNGQPVKVTGVINYNFVLR